MTRALALALLALLAAAAPAAARPEAGRPGGYRAEALVCSHDPDARLRVWWSDTPGDPDAPAGADGDCATVPPWVSAVAAGARHALDVARVLGFPPPPGDGRRGGDPRYDVYVLDLGARQSRLLGLAEPDDGDGRTSSLTVDESYVDELPADYPTSPADELRVTLAHELFHAVQFGMGAGDLPTWILEGTAAWFEAQAHPGIPDNHGYLVRHLTGDRGRLPLWVSGACLERCWVPGLPQDEGHVYAAWLFFWSAADERGDRDLVRRLLTTGAREGTDEIGLDALWRASRGDLAVRLREYAVGLLVRRRIGSLPLPAALAAGPAREPAVAPGRPGSGRLWPLQALFVPVGGGRTVAVRSGPLPAAAFRRALALVTADGAVLRLPRVDGDALVFDLPAGSTGGTLVLTSARRGWPLRYQVRVTP